MNIHSKDMRATRDLLRRRTRTVQHGAMLKAHVVNTTSQYNLPPNKVNLKNVGAREQVHVTFAEWDVQRNIDLDLDFPYFSRHASLTAVEVNDAGHEYGEKNPKALD